ncbi:MAG: NADP-dependent isocitrate dehydrogenase, partial [Myxococcales bacterium]|nr:NADP-dependent isocitrate dehydrogenase [Myxococcales bacterium]
MVRAVSAPNSPVVPVIVGDGIGPDIWAATVRVLDAAVARAHGEDRRIRWLEVPAGESALASCGEHLPEATIAAFAEHRVGIKGPLSTPVGGGVRSLNITLRDRLDLCVCMRPIRWFPGVPSPVKHPERTDMVVFRENTEDI